MLAERVVSICRPPRICVYHIPVREHHLFTDNTVVCEVLTAVTLKDYRRLECDAVWFRRYVPFWSSMFSMYSGHLFYADVGSSMFLRNVDAWRHIPQESGLNRDYFINL
jgi:hypothetical protein